MQMTKQMMIVGENLKSAKDKNYIQYTYDNIINSLLDYEGVATHIEFDKNDDTFKIKFNLKICKHGDLLLVLILEYLKTILETEDNVNITVNEQEQSTRGIIYRIYKYEATEQ